MKRRMGWLLFLLVILVGVRLVYKTQGYGADLSAYRDAVVTYGQGVDPYEQFSVMNFVYPPSFLILNGWMAGMDKEWVGAVWQAGLIVSLAAAAWWWTRGERLAWRGFVWLVTLMFFPVGFALGMGQVSLLLLGLLTLAGYCQAQRYGTWEGIVIGLAGAIKLVPLVWLLVALKERRYKTVAVGLVVFGAINLLAMIKQGDWGLVSSFFGVMAGSVINESVYYFNQGLPAWLYRLGVDGNWVRLAVGLVWVWCWWMMGKLRRTEERLALVAAVATLTATVAWQHHLVLYLPLLWLTFRWMRERRDLSWWIWWWTVVVLVGMNLKNPGVFGGGSLWYNHAAVGGILLLLLISFGGLGEGIKKSRGIRD